MICFLADTNFASFVLIVCFAFFSWLLFWSKVVSAFAIFVFALLICFFPTLILLLAVLICSFPALICAKEAFASSCEIIPACMAPWICCSFVCKFFSCVFSFASCVFNSLLFDRIVCFCVFNCFLAFWICLIPDWYWAFAFLICCSPSEISFLLFANFALESLIFCLDFFSFFSAWSSFLYAFFRSFLNFFSFLSIFSSASFWTDLNRFSFSILEISLISSSSCFTLFL